MSNTRRTAAPRAAENKANGKPVTLDLDAYQAEAVREPFSFTLGGKTFVMPHVMELDWHVSAEPDGTLRDPSMHDLLKAGLGKQWEAFNKLPLTSGGKGRLHEAWFQHSGIDMGEGTASPGSSASTAGQ